MTIFCSRLLSILKDNGLPSFPLQMTPFVRLCIMKAGHFKYVRMGVCMSGRLLCLIRASRQKKAVGGREGKGGFEWDQSCKGVVCLLVTRFSNNRAYDERDV